MAGVKKLARERAKKASLHNKKLRDCRVHYNDANKDLRFDSTLFITEGDSASGSITKRLGIEDGTVLKEPLIEYCLKDDALGDPLIAEEHIYAFEWANKKEIEKVKKMILRINDFMIGMFRGVGIKLIDFKLEFGRLNANGKKDVILADEISPDTCRLWDSLTDKKLDKDRFRKDLGDLIPAYTEVAKRLGILHEQSNLSAVNVTKLSSVKRKRK